MELKDLKKSISDMNDEELQEALLNIRKRRRETTQIRRKVGKKGVHKNGEEKKINMKNISKSNAQLLLDLLSQMK